MSDYVLTRDAMRFRVPFTDAESAGQTGETNMKLTNAELTARDAHIEALNTAHAAMLEAIRAYNAALSAATSFAESVSSERREEWDGRSERWQDSDAGQNAATLVEDWEGFAETEEVDEPENAAETMTELTVDSTDL